MQREALDCVFSVRPREGLGDVYEDQEGTFRAFRGEPAQGYWSFHFQAAWLWQERGGRLVEEITPVPEPPEENPAAPGQRGCRR